MPFTVQIPFQPDSYDKILRAFRNSAQSVFVGIALSIAKRYFDQIKQTPPSDRFLTELLNRVWTLSHEQDLPLPLPKNEIGEPTEHDFDYLNLLSESCLEGLPKHRTEDHLRELSLQLFITLLSPEFRSCRQSYNHKEGDGSCLRQTADHCTDRISGSHCEDCPYFVALTASQNRKLLERSWIGSDPFSQHETVFLPEDFRSLRVFWYLHLRHLEEERGN